jgi:hypothetical protein
MNQQMQEQMENPQHCHIKLSTGRLICHREDSENLKFRKGDPIRFTKLAAERILNSNSFLGERAVLVPISPSKISLTLASRSQ